MLAARCLKTIAHSKPVPYILFYFFFALVPANKRRAAARETNTLTLCSGRVASVSCEINMVYVDCLRKPWTVFKGTPALDSSYSARAL